jgi:membrane protease YdiL (CAAX protease family)
LTDAVRADRWLNLVGVPAFLRAVGGKDQAVWRPFAALGLAATIGYGLGLVAAVAAGLVNTALLDGLAAGGGSWPKGLSMAKGPELVHCDACLLGGLTEMVVNVAGYLAVAVAFLTSAAFVYRRRMRSFVTSTPHFRWRLFLAGVVMFGLVLAAIAAAPEAVHGWPDRPLFLKPDEAVRIRIAYVAVLLIGLPITAAVEEIFCRGFLLQVTAAFTRNLPAILLVNSLVFALLHFDADPGRNLARTVLGLTLSWGVLRTGGLELGIGIHTAQNLVVLLLQTPQQSAAPPSSAIGVVLNLLVSLVALVIIELVAGWPPLRRLTGLDAPTPPDQPPVRRAKTTLAAP